MKLNLKNPIIFFDLETTGINVASDRIVEISYIKVFPDGKEETKTYRVNPTIPIPKQASDIHGILDKDVKDEPAFVEIQHKLIPFQYSFQESPYLRIYLVRHVIHGS